MEKNMKIAVAGTGYVGLSIATLLSQHHHVTAVDVIPEKVDLINQRKSPIQDEYIEKYLAEKDLDLTATLDGAKAYADADFVVIAAPTNYDPVKNYFDTSHVEEVIDLVLDVNPDAVMVIKSTIPVGYTRGLYLKYARKGVKRFNLLFSPEFLRESKALYDNLYPSRIIVGCPKLIDKPGYEEENEAIEAVTDVAEMEGHVKRTAAELDRKKHDYARALRYARASKAVGSPLLFVLSARSVTQLYRRSRYAREYANYQRTLAGQIEDKQDELLARQNELLAARAEKNRLKAECERQKELLQKQHEEEQKNVSGLKQRQKQLKTEVARQQKQLSALDAKIDQLVAYEIEQARKREEARPLE